MHYVERDDSEAHDVLLCIQTERPWTARTGFASRRGSFTRAPGNGGAVLLVPRRWKHLPRPLSAGGPDWQDPPAFPLEEGVDHAGYLGNVCEEGLRAASKSRPELYERRARHHHRDGLYGLFHRVGLHPQGARDGHEVGPEPRSARAVWPHTAGDHRGGSIRLNCSSSGF